VTYESFAGFWPSQEGEFADKLHSMPKYVVSATLKDPAWTNSTVLDGDVVEEAAKLRQNRDGDVVVHGSAQLVQALVEHDLVDELRLMVFPVLVGAGKRLFGDTSGKKPLRQVDSRTVGDGVALLTYRPAGEEAKASTPNQCRESLVRARVLSAPRACVPAQFGLVCVRRRRDPQRLGTPSARWRNAVLVGGLPAGGPFWGENRAWSPADVVAAWSPSEAVS
jgi:dihydrofolate reductase